MAGAGAGVDNEASLTPQTSVADAVATAGRGAQNVKTIGWVLAISVGLYFIGRAVLEPFVIDVTDPATYHNDWGGPSLAGVLAVHCGPGILALAAMLLALRRRSGRVGRR
jgi:hypothetical protein